VAAVRIDRPPPGEELNTGEVTEARPASTVIPVRDGETGLELLLVQRNPASRFMGGAWVFPGGAVHEGETEAETAVREAEEEASLKLDADTLVPFSRWITPRQVKVRFDTHFFVAPTPADAAPACDGEECVDLRWIAPAAALEAGKADELMLVFPTIKHLEQLTEFGTVEELLEHARARQVQPVEPRVLVDGGVAQVLLPGEPGYDAA
jgi:8-oxo-dGTP pyrophosphatase MutT (NUDIX family)